ncbi:MAG: metalloregulator ArsR/SmtB family transcription factor [Elusimicrobiaceae bacterium]
MSEDLIFKIKADFLKALSHPVRLAIIEQLKNGPVSVGQIVKSLGLEQSGVSKHLSILREAGIVASRQEKVTVYYSIKDKDIFKVLRPISEILRKNLQASTQVLKHLGKIKNST